MVTDSAAEKSTAARSIDTVARHVWVFLDTVFWVICGAFPAIRSRILLTVLLDLYGVGTAGLALGGVVMLARAVETEGQLRVGPFVADVAGPGSIIALVAFLVLMGVSSAASLYVAARRVVRMTVDYEGQIRGQLLCAAAELQNRSDSTIVPRPRRSALSRILNQGIKSCAVALRIMLGQIVPLLMLVVALLILFLVNPLLTLALALLAVPFLLILYRVGRQAVVSEEEFMVKSPVSRNRIGSLLASLLNSDQSADHKRRSIEAELDEPVHQRSDLLFYQRRLTPIGMRYVNAGFGVLSFGILVVFFILTDFEAQVPWLLIIVYLFVLRVATGALTQVSSGIAMLSRRYPDINRVRRFTQSGVLEQQYAYTTGMFDLEDNSLD